MNDFFHAWRSIDRKHIIKWLASYVVRFQYYFPWVETTQWGLTRKPRKRPLVVSLTSYPGRIRTVYRTLNTLLRQYCRPDKLILWLAEEQFPGREADLPESILRLVPLGLTIAWTKDIRSYKKLIPTLEVYPDALIATADDDIYYPRDWLQKLYNSWQQQPECIHCHRAHIIQLDTQKNVSPYTQWEFLTQNPQPRFTNFFTGAGGVFYDPKLFHTDVVKEELFMHLAPTADDIWFWAMCVLQGTKIRVINKPIWRIYEVETDTKESLFQINVVQNDVQMKAVLDAYPVIHQCLVQEWNETH